MWLELLIPLTLVWPVLALAVEGTPLRRYRGTPARELAALGACVVAFFLLWIVLDRALEAATGSAAAGMVAATALSLLAVPPLLFLSFKLLGVRPGESGAH